LIRPARENKLPDKIMMNVHPQRWEDRALPWVRELVLQNVKNVVKGWMLGNRRWGMGERR
jgi:hypothetical protein